MLADIKITYANQADIKAEDNCVVVFTPPANGPSAIAWQVIKNIGRNDSYDFEYPSRTSVQATWDGGRSGTARQEIETSSVALVETDSGFTLASEQPGATPNQFSVVNKVEISSGIAINVFKAGKPIMKQSHVAKGQRVEFVLPPKLCWAVVPASVAVGDTIDLDEVDCQEVDLQGRTELSVTLKGTVEAGYQFEFSALTQPNPPVVQVRLAPTLTIDCARASLAAYRDYERQRQLQLPSGYRCIDRFTGWDEVFNSTGRRERFGLILQSILKPSTYLIAFRGTDSFEDAYEDLWIETVPFVPYARQIAFPSNVSVADGFNSIYTLKGRRMRLSMQEQLFKKISKLTPAPQEIITTGHSLGAPLASLFTLDLAHSCDHNIRLTSITFASPRVGLQSWKETYNKTYNLEPTTYRIANYWDLIPSLPPKILTYRHIGQQFLVSFYVKGAWFPRHSFPHYGERHSLTNYTTVIEKAVELDPQIYVGDFYNAAHHRTLESTVPPSVDIPAWAEMLYEAEQTEVAQQVTLAG
ncbi:MAG: lipase family protein [Cyanobacteria bacterium J06634_5]